MRVHFKLIDCTPLNKMRLCGSQAWAVVSGKIITFPNDKARWKTNFRCNLNNHPPCFRLIKDNSKTADPHKVYEIINSQSKAVLTSSRCPVKASTSCYCHLLLFVIRLQAEKKVCKIFKPHGRRIWM